MANITWDAAGSRAYETGVDHGVLYLQSVAAGGTVTYSAPIPWNGLTAVKEATDGGDIKPMYADNIKYLELQAAENFKVTIEAYTYPDEFMECDGSKQLTNASTNLGVFLGQQDRTKFGFSYRTKMGTDAQPNAGYKIHLIYGCLASPSSRDYNTVNDSPEAITFSWEISTTPPEAYSTFKPSSHVIIDTTLLPAGKLTAIENKLYDESTGTLPSIADLMTILTSNTP